MQSWPIPGRAHAKFLSFNHMIDYHPSDPYIKPNG